MKKRSAKNAILIAITKLAVCAAPIGFLAMFLTKYTGASFAVCAISLIWLALFSSANEWGDISAYFE